MIVKLIKLIILDLQLILTKKNKLINMQYYKQQKLKNEFNLCFYRILKS